MRMSVSQKCRITIIVRGLAGELKVFDYCTLIPDHTRPKCDMVTSIGMVELPHPP